MAWLSIRSFCLEFFVFMEESLAPLYIDCALLVNYAEIIRQCFEIDVAHDMVFVPYLFALSDVVCFHKLCKP